MEDLKTYIREINSSLFEKQEIEKRDITLKWRGSKNQRVIDVKKSLQQNKIVLYCD